MKHSYELKVFDGTPNLSASLHLMNNLVYKILFTKSGMLSKLVANVFNDVMQALYTP